MIGTALEIVKQASGELGLPVPTQLVGSRDQQSQQMLALLNACGNELVRMGEWQVLRKTAVIQLVSGQSEYPLASDFSKLMNETAREKGSVHSVHGPVSAPTWAYLNNNVTLGPEYAFIIKNRKFHFNPPPGDISPGSGNISYEYVSEGWVLDYKTGNTSPMITNDLDLPQYDFWLLVYFLKLKVWESKGLDTTANRATFNAMVSNCLGQDHGAPILYLSHRGSSGMGLLAPDTGYGKP